MALSPVPEARFGGPFFVQNSLSHVAKGARRGCANAGAALSSFSHILCIGAGVPSDQLATPTMKTDKGGRAASSDSWPGVKNQ